MRLSPIDEPRGPTLRFAHWLARRRFGVVPGPLRVVYARAPALARASYQLGRVEEKALSLEPGLGLLIHALASGLNGCGFCVDIAQAMAVERGVGLEKFGALADWETSPLFGDRERAALRYAVEVTRTGNASDPTFEELRKHFDEREIVEITWVNALANYYNLINVPLGLESDGLCALAREKHAPGRAG